MIRIINLLLTVTIMIGLVMLVRQREELTEARSQRDRLAKSYGILDVKDPNKFYVTRIETDDSTHFLWRVHCPANLRIEERSSFVGGGGGSSSSARSSSGEFIYRCRFTFAGQFISAHVMNRGGGGRTGFGDADLGHFVKEHWDELEFDVLGGGEFAIDEPLPFLSIRIPDRLLTVFDQNFENHPRRQALAEGPLFQIVYGTAEAFEKLDKNHAEGRP